MRLASKYRSKLNLGLSFKGKMSNGTISHQDVTIPKQIMPKPKMTLSKLEKPSKLCSGGLIELLIEANRLSFKGSKTWELAQNPNE